MRDDNDILTLDEMAAELKVGPSDVKRLYRQGKLPGAKVSSREYRFRAVVLKRYMEGEEAGCARSEPPGSTQDPTGTGSGSSGMTPPSDALGNELLALQIAGKLSKPSRRSSSSDPEPPGLVLSLNQRSTRS